MGRNWLWRSVNYKEIKLMNLVTYSHQNRQTTTTIRHLDEHIHDYLYLGSLVPVSDVVNLLVDTASSTT